jgi:hypothetical protein
MTTVNVNDLNSNSLNGTASMQNGDFLTFDMLVKNKFALIIPKLPNVQFFLQTISLPSVNIHQVTLQTRIVDYNEIGEKMDFEPFNVTFLVDKYSRNWASVYNWMKQITVGGSSIGKSDDVVLMIDNKEFIRFYGAWPTSLSGYDLDTTIDGLQYVKATLTLNYDYFDLISAGNQTVDSQYK